MMAEKIRINLNNLLIGDLEIIDKAGRDELPITELVEMLDKVVEGGVRHLPVTALNDITQALMEAVTTAANPESAEAEGN